MRILLIEDDEEICEAIKVQLECNGCLTDICHNGEDALFYAMQPSYDAIVLDRMLPGMDGLSVLHEIRRKHIQTPVIMATAMSRVTDRIDGLDTGADDYIVKPYDIEELTARIRALSRRPPRMENLKQLQYEDLSFNSRERELHCCSRQFRLSKKEASLIEFFLNNPEKTLAREYIMTHVWGADTVVEDGNLDNYIHFLRKRMKALESCVAIKTIHGAGYRLQKNME